MKEGGRECVCVTEGGKDREGKEGRVRRHKRQNAGREDEEKKEKYWEGRGRGGEEEKVPLKSCIGHVVRG